MNSDQWRPGRKEINLRNCVLGVYTFCSEWDETTGLPLKQTVPDLMEDSESDLPSTPHKDCCVKEIESRCIKELQYGPW